MMTLRSMIVAAAVLASAPAAFAAPSIALKGRADVMNALSACRSITDPSARLDCYDKATAALEHAEAAGDVVIVDRAQARAARRQAFGFNLSALSVFDRSLARDEANSLSATAAEAYRNADGKWVVVLDTGARWRQVDDEALSKPPHPGSAIKIRHGTLGSYVMNVDGQPYIKVHRDD
jgi:hypothetical protein